MKFGNFQDLEAIEPEEARDVERAMVEPKSTEEGQHSFSSSTKTLLNFKFLTKVLEAENS